MKINREGCSRIVILTKNYAIKIPNFLDSYKSLLNGLMANLEEKEMDKLKWKSLCPILFSLPFSILIVMPKCRELSDEEFLSLEFPSISEDKPNHTWIGENGYYIKVEKKSNSFGWLDGKVVAIDYGN